VPRLADEGRYVASESSFYRVLHEEQLQVRRGHARAPKSAKPKEHVAEGPCEVWSWDITYLRGPVRGTFFYLYLFLDIYSRKIVAAEVHAEESMGISSQVFEGAREREGATSAKLVLHSDNGGPMKGSTMVATLQRLGVVPSFSRPCVSDDNPYAEALFRTLKYRPGFPRKPFANIEEARRWVDDFVRWYNTEHLHSGVRFVTPDDRHEGRDTAILAARRKLYNAAKKAAPRRWTGAIRNWTPVGAVVLNPTTREVRSAAA
jgi:putative transposase